MSPQKPRILIAWELGAGYGHASSIAEVIAGLRNRAHVTVAAKDPLAFREIAPGLDVDLLPAPVARPLPPAERQDVTRSYPDDLRHVGWSNPLELATLTETWGAIIRLAKPDLLAAQAAPTALLAARGMGLGTAIFGHGYDCPPAVTPFPPFFHWTEGATQGRAAQDLADRETRVVETANRALRATARPPIQTFADILRPASPFLSSFAEIDGYAPRAQFGVEAPAYLGSLSATNIGQTAQWRSGGQIRLFAYLRADTAQGLAAVEACAGLPPMWDVLVVAPGLTKATAERFQRPHVRLFAQPIRMDDLLPDCDVGLSHGSNGVASLFAAAGAPQVCLPLHAEQVMCSRALAVNGLALGLAGKYGPNDIRDALLKIPGLPRLKQNAQALAKRAQRQDQLRAGERIANGLLRLIDGPVPGSP